MEIRGYCCYSLISCVLLFPCFLCKTVSLNDIIGAEEQTASLQTPHLKVSETESHRRKLLNSYKILTSTFTKHMTDGSIAHTNKKISPLKYRKTFQIRAPLRPKKIKYSHKHRNRSINPTTKREIDNNEKFNRNYIPLLRSLSVLFNNILGSDSGNDFDSDEYYHKLQSISNEDCPCAQSRYKIIQQEPTKKAIVVTTSVTTEVSTKAQTIAVTETPSPSAYNTVNDNNSPLRRYKNVPILSARNSISSWGNNNGFREGGLSTHYRNIEGNIAGNNGSDENNYSGRKATESYTENLNQYTIGSSRDDASCNGFCGAFGRNRNITSNTTNKASAVETIIRFNETFRDSGGDGNQLKGFDKFETRRNKTKSGILLSQSSSRLRRFESQEESTEVLWQIENPEKSSFDVTYNFTRNQRVSNRNGSLATKNKKIRPANKKLTLDDLSTSITSTSKNNLTKDKQKIVVIYDGYSIARDVNGENKLTEKAYRIQS